ncbi:MAG TPA: tetratricopeptide repeat protein [Thermoanaerobaculia bacterium]|nr:tetratricopeptide repeat protein [Thermoanaerobaculia bacterium]
MPHPDRKTLVQYLNGALPDGASRALQRHLLLCPACEERLVELAPGPAPSSSTASADEDYQGLIRRLLDSQRAEVAAIRHGLAAERAAAPGLWREIAPEPQERRRRRVLAEPWFQTWGFFELLIDRAYAVIQEDPRAAEDLLRLAVEAAGRLGPDGYGRGASETAQARAWIWLANILRVQGDFQQAEAAVQTAGRHLSRGWLDPLDEALLLEVKGALRRGQRRFEEAVELLDAAIDIYREVNEPHLQGRALGIKGLALQYTGDFSAAADCFRTSLFLIDGLREPRLVLTNQYNLICCLHDAGQSSEAASLIVDARRLAEQVGGRSDLLRLRWAEGKIAASRGRLETAEAALREVREAFIESALAFDAALVSLDLAAVYLRQHRAEETKRLAAELIPVFQAREVHREVLAALIVFQRAAEMEQLTAGLIEETAARLRQARGNPQPRPGNEA